MLKSPDGGVWICSGDSFRGEVRDMRVRRQTRKPLVAVRHLFESVLLHLQGVVFVLWAVFPSKRPHRPDHYDFPSKRTDYL